LISIAKYRSKENIITGLYLFAVIFTYSAFVGLFSGVTAHVYNKHVLRFKRFFTTRAILPAADKSFFATLNVIVVNVLYELILCIEFNTAIAPVAMSFYKVTGFIFNIRCVRGRTIVLVYLVSMTTIIMGNILSMSNNTNQSFVFLSPLYVICRCAVRFDLCNDPRC